MTVEWYLSTIDKIEKIVIMLVVSSDRQDFIKFQLSVARSNRR